MTTTSNRTLVKTELLAQIGEQEAVLAVKAGVTRRWPGDELRRDHVYILQTPGTGELPTSAADRLQRDDFFTIDLVIRCTLEGRTDVEAEVVCESIKSAIFDVVAADGQLGASHGRGVDGLLSIVVAEDDGPDTVPGEEGWLAIAHMKLECHSRIL